MKGIAVAEELLLASHGAEALVQREEASLPGWKNDHPFATAPPVDAVCLPIFWDTESESEELVQLAAYCPAAGWLFWRIISASEQVDYRRMAAVLGMTPELLRGLAVPLADAIQQLKAAVEQLCPCKPEGTLRLIPTFLAQGGRDLQQLVRSCYVQREVEAADDVLEIPRHYAFVDVMDMFRTFMNAARAEESFGLDALVRYVQSPVEGRHGQHTAATDAIILADVYQRFVRTRDLDWKPLVHVDNVYLQSGAPKVAEAGLPYAFAHKVLLDNNCPRGFSGYQQQTDVLVGLELQMSAEMQSRHDQLVLTVRDTFRQWQAPTSIEQLFLYCRTLESVQPASVAATLSHLQGQLVGSTRLRQRVRSSWQGALDKLIGDKLPEAERRLDALHQQVAGNATAQAVLTHRLEQLHLLVQAAREQYERHSTSFTLFFAEQRTLASSAAPAGQDWSKTAVGKVVKKKQKPVQEFTTFATYIGHLHLAAVDDAEQSIRALVPAAQGPAKKVVRKRQSPALDEVQADRVFCLRLGEDLKTPILSAEALQRARSRLADITSEVQAAQFLSASERIGADGALAATRLWHGLAATVDDYKKQLGRQAEQVRATLHKVAELQAALEKLPAVAAKAQEMTGTLLQAIENNERAHPLLAENAERAPKKRKVRK